MQRVTAICISARTLPLTIIQVLAVDLGTDMVPALGLGAEPPARLWLRVHCNFDTDQAVFSWSGDGRSFKPLGAPFTTTFQLTTFQGVRPALFNFNTSGQPGGCADFDDYTSRSRARVASSARSRWGRSSCSRAAPTAACWRATRRATSSSALGRTLRA